MRYFSFLKLELLTPGKDFFFEPPIYKIRRVKNNIKINHLSLKKSVRQYKNIDKSHKNGGSFTKECVYLYRN